MDTKKGQIMSDQPSGNIKFEGWEAVKFVAHEILGSYFGRLDARLASIEAQLEQLQSPPAKKIDLTLASGAKVTGTMESVPEDRN